MQLIDNATNTNFATGLFSRKRIASIMDGLNADQLNTVPAGLDHNIIWNIGHIITSQQLFMYKRSDVPVKLSDEVIDNYKAGSPVRVDVPADEIEYLRGNLLKTLEQVRQDYETGVLKGFKAFELRSGVKLETIEDAISFHAFHEGVHLGWIITIAKLVG